MSVITRRTTLLGIATAPVAAFAASSEARSMSPQEVVDRLEVLAFEIAELLDSYRDGTWYAEVYPSGRFKNPVVFRRNTVSLPKGIRVL